MHLYVLDGFRIVSALIVFFYHAYWNMACSFGMFNGVISQGSIFMTGFFMLSGFVLFKSYSTKNLNNFIAIKSFIFKRIVSIWPMFLTVYIFFLISNHGYTLFQNLLAFPSQISMTFNEFSGFNYLTNSGTWFISCIFICYFLFPLLNIIVSNITNANAIKAVFLLYLLECTAAYYPRFLGIPNYIYTNSFIRVIEFLAGMILAKIVLSGKSINILSRFHIAFLGLLIIFVNIISIYNNYTDYVRNFWPLFTFPLFGLILCSSVQYNGRLYLAICKSKVVQILSQNSYQFWIATFFTTYFVNRYLSIGNNLFRICACTCINFIFTYILYQIQKLLKTFLISYEKLVCLSLCVLVIVISDGLYKNRPQSVYDYENQAIKSNWTQYGVYQDEGNFIWCMPNSRFILRKKSGTLKIKLASNKNALEHFPANMHSVSLYINSTKVAEIPLSDKVGTFEYDISNITTPWFSVELKTPFSFIPADMDHTSSDTRMLSLQLMYLGN